MLREITNDLAYLHGKGFAHSAIQPANLFAVQDQLKLSRDAIRPIGDRGVASSPYNAPELSAQGASPASDVWSLGVTLVEVLTQRLPVSSVSLSDDLPAPFREIAQNCLTTDPNQRWSIAKIATVLEGGPSSDLKPKRPLSMAKTVRIAAVAVFGIVLTGVVVRPWLMPEEQTETTSKTAKNDPPESEAAKKAGPGKPGKPERASNLPPEPAPQQAEPPRLAEKRANPEPSKEIPPRPPAEAPREMAARDSAKDATKDAPKEEGSPALSGDVTRQVLPEVRPDARRTIRGKVAVGIRVRANPAGDVVNATIYSRGPSWYFADLALDAAKKWKFAPAGGDAPREWILQFQFLRTSTKVAARRTTANQ